MKNTNDKRMNDIISKNRRKNRRESIEAIKKYYIEIIKRINFSKLKHIE